MERKLIFRITEITAFYDITAMGIMLKSSGFIIDDDSGERIQVWSISSKQAFSKHAWENSATDCIL